MKLRNFIYTALLLSTCFNLWLLGAMQGAERFVTFIWMNLCACLVGPVFLLMALLHELNLRLAFVLLLAIVGLPVSSWLLRKRDCLKTRALFALSVFAWCFCGVAYFVLLAYTVDLTGQIPWLE